MERKAERKSEYLIGGIFLMAGCTPDHNLIKENLAGEIHSVIKKGTISKSYSSDQRIHIPENSLYTYPDIVVVLHKDIYRGTDNVKERGVTRQE